MKKTTITLFTVIVSFLHFSVYDALAELTSRSVILMNMSTGRILYKHNEYELIPPASLTKVLSMHVALDLIDANLLSMNTVTEISPSAAATDGSSMHLREGERVTVERLLLGMAVSSGNNASLALAQCIADDSSTFVELMNAKAAELGMFNTTFMTPHGLPAEGQFTTAYDMLRMARNYMFEHPEAMFFHNTTAFTHNDVVHVSTNRLLSTVDGMYGLKTGYTRASGHNLIFTARRDNVNLLGVILGGQSRDARDADAVELLEAGFAHPDSAREVAQALGRPTYSASTNRNISAN